MTEDQKELIKWESQGPMAQMDIISKGFGKQLMDAQLLMLEESKQIINHFNLSPLEMAKELERLSRNGSKISTELRNLSSALNEVEMKKDIISRAIRIRKSIVNWKRYWILVYKNRKHILSLIWK